MLSITCITPAPQFLSCLPTANGFSISLENSVAPDNMATLEARSQLTWIYSVFKSMFSRIKVNSKISALTKWG